MIEWSLIGSGALSIAGLAMVLAAVSYLHWLACGTGQHLGDLLRGRAGAIPCSVGFVLFCAGLAIGRQAIWWERPAWSLAGLFFVWQLASQLRGR